MHTVGPGLWREKKNPGKWETRTVGGEIHKEHWKMTKWVMHTVGHEFMTRNTEKRGKLEMHTVGPGIW